MDHRGKSGPGRGGKSKAPQHPANFIALGSKGSRPDLTESKRPGMPPKVGPSSSGQGVERKRDPSVSVSMPLNKKPKLDAAAKSEDAWDSHAIECDPADLVASISQAMEDDDANRARGLLCGGLLLLRRGKVDKILMLSLLLIGKQWPKLLTPEIPLLCLALCTKGMRSQTTTGICYLLMKALQHQTSWPELLARVYAEDSAGDRQWVDLEEARPLVENICLSFGTKKPTRSIVPPEVPAMSSEITPEVSAGHCDSPAREEDAGNARRGAAIEAIDTGLPMERYKKEAIESVIVSYVKDCMANRPGLDPNYKNLAKLMITASGLQGIRLAAIQKLDGWLQSPKLLKPSQDLLLSICANCTSSEDTDIVGHIVKLKCKSKPILNCFLMCIRELIAAYAGNLGLLLKLVVYNELSSTRNQNNMQVLSTIFSINQDQSSGMLAEVFHELLIHKEDYLKAMRNFLREMFRNVREKLNVIAFCRALLQDRSTDPNFRESGSKERMLNAIPDIVCLTILLSITLQVKESASLLARGDTRETSVSNLINFQNLVAKVQQDAAYWLRDTVVKMYRPSEETYTQVMKKVFFLESSDQYHNKDNWPPESDRGTMYRLASDVPVLQKTLIVMCMIGMSNENPITIPNLIDVMERIVRRAALIANEHLNPLHVDKVELLPTLFKLCKYKHPQHYNFSSSYSPPKLAILNSYWKAWSLAVVLAAFNPTTVGAVGWGKHATLRALMEMCITNTFHYPPPTMALKDEDLAKEAHMIEIERRQMLEYEALLAEQEKPSRVITEQSSHFLQTLTVFDPIGPARRPPPASLAELQSLNDVLHLGHRLCRCRSPDFLLDVIQRQGTSQAMPWLADLVNSSDGSLCHLPVQCLCEFLLSDLVPMAEHSRQQKHQQLVNHLKNMLAVKDSPESLAQCLEVLVYFMGRLGSHQACNRHQAIKALRLLLDEDEDEVNSNNWVLDRLPSLPHFSNLKSNIIVALRQACLSENDISTLRCYLRFLAEHAVKDADQQCLADLTVDMATVVVERNIITHMLLPSKGQQDCDEAHSSLAHLMEIFINHITTSRVPRRESYAWSHNQDHILVEWPTEECYLHILVVHASVLLLTYGQGRHHHLFKQLHEIWLGTERPRGRLTDTFEEAVLFPDWLKLKMIQSEAPGLAEAALADLEPPQLLLFAQNFGIPPSNMSKLLATLDRAVDHEPQAVAEALQDRSYMVQLVRVQHYLGAKNGHTFLHFLDPSNQAQPEELPESPEIVVRRPLPLQTEKAPEPKAMSALLPSLFSEDGHEARAAFSLIHKTVCNELSEGDSDLLLSILHHVVREIRNRPSFAHYALARPLLLWPLVRLAVSTRPKPAVREALAQLAEQLKCTNTPMTHMLASTDQQPKFRASRATVAEEATQRLLCQQTNESTGHLLDSLATLETVPIEQQMQLLFGRGHTTCRPYLLTLLTHGSTWSTLHNCMTHLLRKADPSYDPGAVLDFLWALIGNPKLWQGREKRPSKHQVRDDILGLSLEQACVLLDYVLEEALVVGGQELSDGRVALLLQCLSLEYLRPMVRHLAACLQSADKAAVSQQLLLQLYLAMPVLINGLNDCEKDLLIEGTNLGACALDISSHTLLSALASSAGPPKEWNRRSQEFELAARKMTATHPLLVLRQLPMLAASLQGRVHYESGVFRHRNHLIYFLQVLGLLEVLQPHIFQTEYAQSLELILDSFFAMFQLHNQLKDVQIALSRTVALLQSFVSYDAQRALKYLQRHCQLLHDLHAAYPNVSGLQPLLAGLSLPARDGDEPEVLVAAAAVSAAEAQQPPTAMVGQIVGRLGRQQTDDVQQLALHELDQASSRRPAVLEGCVDVLAGLLLHPSIYTRNQAHMLLLRYLRHNPAAAAASVTTFIQCLESSNPDIQASAIEKIPEVVVCAQEYALTILKKLGKLGIEQGIDTTSVILHTVSLLQLQNGC
ncbi:integrator complex subunit 1 [Cloeon dipterum]|uniref:integrator complex subunit 1 n=1 Tax=Cloeon dipterum TaxID=197152 RepID=UPI00322016EA